jgi:hypothetical protein
LLLGCLNAGDLGLAGLVGGDDCLFDSDLGLVHGCFSLDICRVVNFALSVGQFDPLSLTCRRILLFAGDRILSGILDILPVALGLSIPRLRLGQRQRSVLHLGVCSCLSL